MAAKTLITASFDSVPRLHHECHRLLADVREYSIWNAAVAALQFWDS